MTENIKGRERLSQNTIYWSAYIFTILVGIALRLRQYLAVRSLWLDEAFLANNILSRSYSALLQKLDNNQLAPLGFLLSEKAISKIFGGSEIILRTLPFIAGISSVLLLAIMARKILSKPGQILAILLFSISAPLIYYSNELKQYIFDVLCFLLVVNVYLEYISPIRQQKWFIALCLSGIAIQWLSQPSIFILAAILIIETFIALNDSRHKYPRQHILILLGSWGVSFIVLWFLSYSDNLNNPHLNSIWSSYFMPFPPWKGISWIKNSMDALIHGAAGLPGSNLLGVIWITAGILYSFWDKKRALTWCGLLTIGLVFISSSFSIYPIFDRFLLFTAPVSIILFAYGVDGTRILLAGRTNRIVINLISFLGIAVLLSSNIISAFNGFIHPEQREEMRPLLTSVRAQTLPYDHLYIYYGAVPAFEYYSNFIDFSNTTITFGSNSRADPEGYIKELQKLEGNPRVWIIFSHIYDSGKINERNFMVTYLDQIGTRLSEQQEPGAYGYLYELDR